MSMDYQEHASTSLLEPARNSSSTVASRTSRVSKRLSKRHSVGAQSTNSVGANVRHSRSLTAGPIDSFTHMMRRMSSSGSTGSPVAGGSGGATGLVHSPSSASHHTPHMPQIPTLGLLTALPGAAHFSSGTADVPAHEKFRPTFADGEDRTLLDPVRQRILDDTLALFCAKPTLEIFERHWRADAVFEDPLSQCRGYKEYAAQWFGLAKMVSSSKTLSHRVLASTSSPSRIVYSQTQEYTLKLTKKKKVIQSMVVIHLDNDDKITMLEDKWRGDDQPSSWAAKVFRRLNAKTMPIFIHVPKGTLSEQQHQLQHNHRASSRASSGVSGASMTSGGTGSTTSYPPKPIHSQSAPPAVTLAASTAPPVAGRGAAQAQAAGA